MQTANQVSIASDYAVMSFRGLEYPRFYFGYEVTSGGNDQDDDGDWCFQARFSPLDIITIPQPALKLDDGSEMGEFLLAGIAILIERGILERSRLPVTSVRAALESSTVSL